MSSCVGKNKQLNYDPKLTYPISDTSIWAVDEDDVLTFDALYGSMGSHDDSVLNLYQPQMTPTTTMANNYLPGVQLPDIKPQFSLTNNLSLSMPTLSSHPNEPRCQNLENNIQNFPILQAVQPQDSFKPLRIPPQSNVLHHQPMQSMPVLERRETPSPIREESSLVTFVDLKPFYEKGQVRLQGKSEQRLDYSSSFVRIYLEKPDNIKGMTAFVERYPDAAHILKDSIGSVPLKILSGENKSWIKVNLDDAGCEVYKLSKVKGEERNRFHIVLKLVFLDGSEKGFFSDTFQVKSKPKSTDLLVGDGGFDDIEKITNFDPDIKRKPLKRCRTDDNDVMTSSPGSIGSTVFPEVITDHLQATTATIDQLKILQPIQTNRGDIAYHFKLNKRPSDPLLEEGDIIGFFESSDGKTEIKPLTCENVHKSKLAGVVSRSAWLEGKKPDNSDVTDMVCVIGVVKVKVRGQVKNGERIYASLLSYPGVAMPEDVITHVTSNELTLIGQSLESVENAKPDEINLVSCFVSILLSIHTKYTTKAMEEMRSEVLVDVGVKINKEKRRCIRGLIWKLAIVFVFLGLLAVLFYQLYAPKTAYRYWKCKQGSTGEISSFTFTTMNKQIAKVNGVEFDFDELIDKLDLHENTKKIRNHEDHRYYLNVDRCAAGGLRSGVHGPEFYVLDKRCTTAYYYLHNKYGYQRYRTFENIVCSHNSNIPAGHMYRTQAPPLRIKTTRPNVKNNTDNLTSQSPRYGICHHDVKPKNGQASFVYTSSSTGKKTIAAGIQVTLDTLREKTNKTIDKLADPEVRYYFNVNRCLGTGEGPTYFAMVGACDNAYYYATTWRKYRSAKQFQCFI